MWLWTKSGGYSVRRVQVSIDICGVDCPSWKRRFEVVYNLLSTRYNSRICVQTSADEVTWISPVVSLFPSAGRWEREVWDVFGVSFINHTDLCRISTDYGFVIKIFKYMKSNQICALFQVKWNFKCFWTYCKLNFKFPIDLRYIFLSLWVLTYEQIYLFYLYICLIQWIKNLITYLVAKLTH